jgi:dihydrolipoamide dehydrogenase
VLLIGIADGKRSDDINRSRIERIDKLMDLIQVDVAIIGGGPGAYVAAPLLKSAGLKTVVVEEEALGGTCLKWGCMPTKALTAVSSLIDRIRKAEELGILGVSSYEIDFSRIMRRNRDLVRELEENCLEKFDNLGIVFIRGRGTLINEHEISVDAESKQRYRIRARQILIDTGSIPAVVEPFDKNQDYVLDNKGILSLEEKPEKLLIVGGGVMGCEFANIFANLGTRVTIVECLPRLLPTEEQEISELIEQDFRRRTIDVYTGSKVEKLSKGELGFQALLDNGKTVCFDNILLNVGRKPNIEDLGIKSIGIEVGKSGIVVDSSMRTNIGSIYAIGDVTGGYLAHTSRKEGEIAAKNMLGMSAEMDYSVVPATIYTSLEIARVGITEQEAYVAGFNVAVAKVPFLANGKAFVMGETDGFVKVITEKDTGKILGCHIVGSHVSDLIHEIVLAMTKDLTIGDIGDAIHAHPTLSEAFVKAANSLR